MASLSLLCPIGCCHWLACPALSPLLPLPAFSFLCLLLPRSSLCSLLFFPSVITCGYSCFCGVPDDSLVAVNLCVFLCVWVSISVWMCWPASDLVCVAPSICVTLLMYLSLSVGPHFLLHLSTGLVTLCVQAAVCMCVLCFNSGGQAAVKFLS